MSSRERVLSALNHKEPDRVPVCPPGGRVNLSDEVKRFIEESVFDRFISLNFRKNLDERHESSDGVYVDNYGCIYRHKGVSTIPYCIHNPLHKMMSVDEVEAYERWPDPNDPSLVEKDAQRKAEKFWEETSYVTAVRVEPLFHRYAWMRGFEYWLTDMKINPELYDVIASKIFNIRLESTLRLLNEVGDYTDLVQMSDDMGSTKGPFMSVDDFRRFVKPYYAKLIGEVKKEFPRLKFWLHSHGAIAKLVPDIIDFGIDVLNPVLPGDNMNPNWLKMHFGDQLCFDGGVDVESVLPFGTVDQVEEHVKEVIKTLAPRGGYLFRVQMISNIVPYENLRVAYEKAVEQTIS